MVRSLRTRIRVLRKKLQLDRPSTNDFEDRDKRQRQAQARNFDTHYAAKHLRALNEGEEVEEQRFIVSGEVAVLNSTSIEITELPVRVWTQTYKETVLETMLHGTEKVPPLISDYKEYHTDTTVRFVVTMAEEKLAKAREEGLHKAFKLQTTFTTSSMVLFDSKGVLRTFRTPEDILRDFFDTRLQAYVNRKAYLIGLLSAEAKRLENQARFILEKIGNIIKIENRRRKEMLETLRQRGYDPDPILIWKKKQLQQTGRRDSQDESQDEGGDAAEEPDEERDKDGGSVHYNYLLGMPLWSLTMERKDDLLKKRDEKRELEVLRRKSPENLWEEDLDAFSAKLDEVEQAQRDEEDSTGVKTTKGSKGGRSKVPIALGAMYLQGEACPVSVVTATLNGITVG
nr:DNA topoisomerase 2-alpha-like [Rhipicephalus microplus]